MEKRDGELLEMLVRRALLLVKQTKSTIPASQLTRLCAEALAYGVLQLALAALEALLPAHLSTGVAAQAEALKLEALRQAVLILPLLLLLLFLLPLHLFILRQGRHSLLANR